MNEEKMEMSTVDRDLPRYYKGYDMDILMTKVLDGDPLEPEERAIVSEAQRIYYAIKFENNRKQMEELEKQYRHVRRNPPVVNLWGPNLFTENDE